MVNETKKIDIEAPETIWINRSKSGNGLTIGIKAKDGKTWVNYISSVKAMNEFLEDESKKGVAFNDAKKAKNFKKEVEA